MGPHWFALCCTGWSVDEVYGFCKIDRWFLERVEYLADIFSMSVCNREPSSLRMPCIAEWEAAAFGICLHHMGS